MSKLRWAAFALVTATSACAGNQPEPITASSASEAGYAERAPAALASTQKAILEQETQAQELTQRFQEYPGELKDPDWARVHEMIEHADQAGRGAGYAERAEGVTHVAEFYEEEKPELHKRVGGSAQYVVKQKGLEADVYGPTVHAMDKAVEKQLEERLRAHNEAHRYIEGNADALGKPNLETLEKQADEIAYASYLSHVAVKRSRDRLVAQTEELEDVEKTLDRVIESSDAIAGDANRSDADRELAKERAQAARDAKAQLAGEAEQAKRALETLDDRIEKMQKGYEEALDQLKREVAKAAEQSPQAAE